MHPINRPLGGRALRSLAAVGACALLALALAGCGRAEKDHLLAARAFFDKRDLASATIELKNALQQNPASGEARYLYGKALFLTGDALGAEAELRRALESRQPPDQTVPQLAAVLVALHRHAVLVKEFGETTLADAEATADLKTQLAIAHMALGALDKADEDLKHALRRKSDHRLALETQARLLAARGDARGALEIVDGALSKGGSDATTLTLRGDVLLQAAGDARGRDAAVEAYRKALSLEPQLVPAHASLVALHLATHNTEEAHRQWKQMRALLPGHPYTRFYEAVLAIQRGEPQRAREIAQQLVRSAPDNPRLHMLAGQAELGVGSLLQAEGHFNRAVMLAPGMAEPRRALVQAYLQMGQPKRALEQLAPLVGPRSKDAEAVALAGRAHLMTGDTRAAEAAFERAAELGPGLSAPQTGMALARLGKGETEAGLAALEAAARRDTSTDADLALINARLSRRQWAAALAAIDGLERKTPGLPLPDLLRGRIALAQGQRAQARARWEAALAKTPRYLPALTALAELDLADGNAAAARARIAEASKAEPGNAALLVALADFTGRAGGSKADVVAVLRQAVRAGPTDAEARIRLIDYALAFSDVGLALSEAQAATSALPEQAAVLERLGRAQQRSGDLQQAITTFGRLASLQPRSAMPQLRLADANFAFGRDEAAAQHARRALEIEPESLAAHQAAAFAALRTGRAADALALARSAQRRWPAAGLQLEASIELAGRNTEAAIAALRKALAAAPGNSEVAIQLHETLVAAGKLAEADAHARAHVGQRPGDSAFVLHLGNVALARGDLAQAEARYRQILKREPNHVEALNNLAHVLALQKRPEAVGLAQQAVKLAPNRPPLMDTLAFAQAANGQLGPALALQKSVVEMSPDEPMFRLSLARLQVQAGEKEPARENLNQLAKRGAAFPQQAEVARLLAELGK